ncbi:MAG: hypothetical protein QOJ64_4176 [Acidobacteriota bacterium]|jgi:hypothetical protein|nr:hypothetical protein [Acidobacteriota bacterium]
MSGRATLGSRWLQAVILLSLLAGAAIWISGSKPASTNTKALRIQVGELRSQAAEGQFLAELSLAGSLTHNLISIEASTLEEDSRALIQTLLSTDAAAELAQKAAQGKELAGRLNTDLQRLSGSFDKPNELESLRDDFAQILSQLTSLEASLKQRG